MYIDIHVHFHKNKNKIVIHKHEYPHAHTIYDHYLILAVVLTVLSIRVDEEKRKFDKRIHS